MASHATLLLSLTALQQQPSPVSLSLPISLPLSDSPRQVTVRHSSANADLTVHSLVVAGQGAGLWVGDLQQQPVCVCVCVCVFVCVCVCVCARARIFVAAQLEWQPGIQEFADALVLCRHVTLLAVNGRTRAQSAARYLA